MPIIAFETVFFIQAVFSLSSSNQETGSVQLDSRGRLSHADICWNCHHNASQLFFALDSAVHAWDVRTKRLVMPYPLPVVGLYHRSGNFRVKNISYENILHEKFCRKSHAMKKF